MGVKVTNNAYGTLSAGIASGDTTITLDGGQGARFPTLGAGDYFYATLVDTANNIEVVKVTARSSDSMTVVRGQDNTTAKAYAIGDRFELRPTAALFNDIQTAIDNVDLSSRVAKTGDTMTGDLILSGVNLRSRITDGTNTMTFGLWDGSNNRIESVGRPFSVKQYGSHDIVFQNVDTGGYLKMDSAGRVTKPYQPGFYATRPSGQSLTSGATNTLVCTSTRYNQGGHYNVSNGAFTAPVAGVYAFAINGLVYPVAEANTLSFYFTINGGTVVTYQQSAPAGSHFQVSHTEFVNLAVNDSVTWRVYMPISGTTWYGNQVSMSGYLLG